KSPATFLCQDMLAADLSKATVIYLFGTCLTDGAILTLIDHFSRLSKDIRIITVSFSLLDYVPEAPFELIDHFEAPFLFGESEVFIHRGQV
ncbi:MAG: hypothetical protein KDK65_04500, partial [Chlamydiia bacterium]|nr:hypothetical protein [Chlamydiia bacterium]